MQAPLAAGCLYRLSLRGVPLSRQVQQRGATGYCGFILDLQALSPELLFTGRRFVYQGDRKMLGVGGRERVAHVLMAKC